MAYKEKKDNRGMIIGILVVVILVLIGFISYVFLIQPQFNGYVIDKQIEAQTMVVGNIINLVEQQGYVQIPLDDQGNVITLVPYVEDSGVQQIVG